MLSRQATESDLQSLYSQVAPTVVRITLDEKGERHVAIGVIVSPEGLVLTIEHTTLWECFRQNRSVFLKLPDGRTARGLALGWSEEWNIALVKFADSDNWPYAKVGKTSSVAAGEFCAAFEYCALDGRDFDQKPAMQIGRVTMCSPSYWFATSHHPNWFAPIFSLDGRLVGITTRKSSPPFQCCATSSELLRIYWGQLAQGVNLDRETLLAVSTANDKLNRTAQGDSGATTPHGDSVPAAIRKASQAAIRITAKGKQGYWSGFIVGPDGYVATCAHHKQLPGSAVTIQLTDGRDLVGKVLGINPISDVALVRITEKGKWPHVSIGNSTTMGTKDPCWLVGYPYEAEGYSYETTNRQPLVRRSQIVERIDIPWSATLYSAKSIRSFGGDSGGGVLDSRGRLIAIHYGQTPGDYSRHGRIELLRKQWGYLALGEPVRVAKPSETDDLDLRLAAGINDAIRPTAVQIYCDDRPQILGAVVGSDGRISTKASELFGAFSVELSTGEKVPAVLDKYSRSLDLALLKVAKTGLPCVQWVDDRSIAVGNFVAAWVPEEGSRTGIVSQGIRAIPIDPGAGFAVAFELRDSTKGVECADVKFNNCFNLPLRKGDIIQSIEGLRTRDISSVVTMLGDIKSRGNLIINVGDRISVQLLRGDEQLDVQLPLPPTGYFLNQSHRCSGFPHVFDTDIPLNPRLCGGPIFDMTGRAVGIAIACRGDGDRQNHVLTAALVQQFLAE